MKWVEAKLAKWQAYIEGPPTLDTLRMAEAFKGAGVVLVELQTGELHLLVKHNLMGGTCSCCDQSLLFEPVKRYTAFGPDFLVQLIDYVKKQITE